MVIILNKEIEKVLKKINKLGYQSYVVGGYVRDYLLGINSTDVDIATNAKPSDLIKIFPNGKTDSNYGSLKFSTNHFNYDITTLREEIYTKEKLEINYIDDLNKDALRRDFTINAIYMDYQGNLIDPLNGMKDLKNKNLKIIGNPNTRFKEDPLRILRTIRFKTELSFKIDDLTVDAINKQKKLLKKISYFRKKEELNKIFISKNKLNGLDLIKKFDLLSILEINYNKVKYTTDPLGIWAQLEYLNEYPFTKQEKNIIEKIKNYKEINNISLYKNGLYISLIASEILNVDKIEVNKRFKQLPIKDKNDIRINYKKIINLGYKENEINDIIKIIEKEILQGNLKNTKIQIIHFLKQRK